MLIGIEKDKLERNWEKVFRNIRINNAKWLTKRHHRDLI